MRGATIEAAAGGAGRPGEGSCGGTFIHRGSKALPHEKVVDSGFGLVHDDWGATADWGGIDPSAEFMRMLPKAELHCHLDGSVRPSTILALSQEQGLTHTAGGSEIPTTLEGVEKISRIGLDCKDLAEYLTTFDLTCSVLQTPSSLTRVVVEAAEDAASDGVMYLELRFSPLLHRAGGMTLTQVLTSVLKGRELAELQLHVRIGFILCGIRTMPESEVVLLSELAWRYRERGVVGFDLAGAEALGKAATFEAAFAHVTSHQLNVTIHAGEADDWTSVHDAVQRCGAQRIGHGCNMIQNTALCKHAAHRQVAVEVCLTSNQQTKAIKNAGSHPIRKFMDEYGIPCVPCVDNSVVSDTSLSQEYALLTRQYRLSPSHVLAMIHAGFRHSFVHSDTRHILCEIAMARSLKVMREAGVATAEMERDVLRLRMPQMCFKGSKRPFAECIADVPVADCGCRLAGSLPLHHIVSELQLWPSDGGKLLLDGVQSVEELNHRFTQLGTTERKEQAMLELLQSPEQVGRGVEAVLAAAIAENVKYLELVVSPSAHGVDVAATLYAIRSAMAKYNHHDDDEVTPTLTSICVLDFDCVLDGPEVSLQLTKAASDPESCFGAINFTWNGDLTSLGTHVAAIDLIREIYLPVSLQLPPGKSLADLLRAVHLLNASRISCATIGDDPELVDYFARRGIVISLSLQHDLVDNDDVGARPLLHPINLLYSAGLSVVLTSSSCTLLPKGGRTGALLRVIEASKLDRLKALKVTCCSFIRSFAPFQTRQRLAGTFWDSMERLALVERVDPLSVIYIPVVSDAKWN